MKLGISMPSVDGAPVAALSLLQLFAQNPDLKLSIDAPTSSLLNFNCNRAWCWALTLRDRGLLDYFLMLHADVRPHPKVGPEWFLRFFAEMERAEADILSAIIPIKDDRGFTSTAIDTHEWYPQRLTTTQINTKLPVTWTTDRLLFNTGMMLVDFRKPWVERVWFESRDAIFRNDADGSWFAAVEPEDWRFARKCRGLGVRAFVTRAVPVEHFGDQKFASDACWGAAVDTENEQACEPVTILTPGHVLTQFDPVG